MGFLSASRTGPAILSTFSVTSAYSAAPFINGCEDKNSSIPTVKHRLSLTAHYYHVGRKLRILRSLRERLNKGFCSFRKTDKIGGRKREKKGKRGNWLTRSHLSFLIEFASPFVTRAHTKSGTATVVWSLKSSVTSSLGVYRRSMRPLPNWKAS